MSFLAAVLVMVTMLVTAETVVFTATLPSRVRVWVARREADRLERLADHMEASR